MDASDFLKTQIWSFPFFLLHLVGIVLAIVRWKEHAAVSLCVLIGCGLLLSSQLLWAGFALIQMNRQDGIDPGNLLLPLRLGGTLLSITGMGLLLTAAFGWRSAQDRFDEYR